MHCTQTAEQILSILPADRIRTMLDGGAYRGDTAEEALNFFPELSSVLAVEPDKKIFKKLSLYAQKEPRVHPIFGALWKNGGEATFYGSSNRNSSLAHASFEHRDDTVPLLTVDEICADTPVDYIK